MKPRVVVPRESRKQCHDWVLRLTRWCHMSGIVAELPSIEAINTPIETTGDYYVCEVSISFPACNGWTNPRSKSPLPPQHLLHLRPELLVLRIILQLWDRVADE